MAQSEKPSILFWIIAVIALIWNGLGVGAYFGQVMMTAEQFAALPPEQQTLISETPFWVTAAFAIAVIGGFVAAIMLLLRKRVAVRLFLVSLMAVIVQFSSYFLIKGTTDHLSGADWVMPIMIPIFALGFYLFARKSERDGILN